jgi:serine/threonine protein kinase
MSAAREEFLQQGQVLSNQFRIGKPFAAGGYAIVYHAVRLSDGAPIVVKTLRQHAIQQDPAAADRFVREGAVATRVKHPNVVQTLQFGQTLDGILYIAMEFLKGKPLENFMFQSPMASAHVYRVMHQLLAGLEAIHALGVVHRDVKPSNVFLCDPTSGPSVSDLMNTDNIKLLDFGFVKFLEESVIPISNNPRLSRPLTLAGDRVGTPGYMAPETLLNGIATPSSDLYSAGIIGYELMTATQAFAGKAMQRAIAQLNSVPARPSRAVTDHPLYPIIHRLIEASPARRYPTATAALKDLAQVILVEDIEVIDSSFFSGDVPIIGDLSDDDDDTGPHSARPLDDFSVIDSVEAFQRYDALETLRTITADPNLPSEVADIIDLNDFAEDTNLLDTQTSLEIEVVDELASDDSLAVEDILLSTHGFEYGYLDLDALNIEVVEQINMGDPDDPSAAKSPSGHNPRVAAVNPDANPHAPPEQGARRWLRFFWSDSKGS